MNTYKHFFLIFFILQVSLKTFATTWDEPWTDKVIQQADYFVLADVISIDEDNGVKIKIIKQLGGENLPQEIEISNFYLLDLKSTSGGHGAEFRFKDITQSYFFIKKNEKGEFCISTPTSGFDFIRNGSVTATYRHSYHQASIPIDIYELTMSAIFNNYHNLNYDKNQIENFLNKTLSIEPASFEEDEIDTFFLQHAALETIFHLKLGNYYNLILPFFNDNKNFHNRISASRALTANNNSEVINLLLNKIKSNKNDDFTTVICIWTLKEFKPTGVKSSVKKLLRKASTKENGFGGNFMDPRVSTWFPTVKSALEDLMQTL